ncbi:hypothetical protein PHYC_02051 [Phycisphaerales bacterium]|nr:hypothetical protein PHYC_02051 [Phycisphaerales bacterium]
MPVRGRYRFVVDSNGRVASTPQNVRLFRQLLLDWSIIDGDGGPGTKADGRGSWHVFCHLAAGAGVFRLPRRGGVWVGITFDQSRRRYAATVCCTTSRGVAAYPLRSSPAATVLRRATWCGFVEGASRGRILDRQAHDPGNPITTDRRQDYDQNPNSTADGGPVWEMWSASRDIRTPRGAGDSLVSAYLELLSVLGGRFASVVARGRMDPEYGHLRQMCAMVDAGLIEVAEALCDIEPVPIPPAIATTLLEATPSAFAHAAAAIGLIRSTHAYYMYDRRVLNFASAALLRRLVRTLGTPHAPLKRRP